MQIDWLTVAAQIVNFLLLVWLLKRFLYGPIVNAMSQREQRIEERLADAKHQREKAAEETRLLQQQQAELAARTEHIMQQTREDSDKLHHQSQQDIQQELEIKRESLRKRIDAESDDAVQDVRKRAAASTFTAIRATLRDFAGTELNEELASRFAAHLGNLSSDQLKRLVKAAQSVEKPVHIVSGTELPSTARTTLARAIHQHIADKVQINYTTDPDLLLGLRLSIAGQTVEWSAAQHLDRLETDIREALVSAGPDLSQKSAA